MAISGADSAKVNRVLTTTLDRYSPQIANEIARNDGIVAVFGNRGRIKVVDGGERAIETLDTAENANFAFRDRASEIPTSLLDNRKQAKYAFATLSGAVSINEVEKAMNAGSARIYDLVEAEINNAKNTIVRLVADALRAASPASTDPESIVTIIPDTATASQTTSTGELSRSSYDWWRSQYSSTSYDVSAAAGIEGLMGFYLDYCAKGTSKVDQPDFALTTGTIFAGLSAGHGDALRQFQPNSKVLELGFQNIQLLNATVIPDPSMASGDLRFINTNFCKLQVLRTPSMQTVGTNPQTLPISVKPFKDAYNSLNAAAIMYITFALTCSSLQRQGIATTCA